MRVAWFAAAARPGPEQDFRGGSTRRAGHAASDPEMIELAAALGEPYRFEQVDEQTAHQFVWRHFRRPYDLTVFVLRDRQEDQFIWPYLFHYPGVLVLRARMLHGSRAHALLRRRRRGDLAAERSFSGVPMLRAPLLASRVVVVHDELVADELRAEYPEVDVRFVPLGVPAGLRGTGEDVSGSSGDERPLRVAVAGGRVSGAVVRAMQRARSAGVHVDLIDTADHPDVVVALEWPATRAVPLAALRAMSAGHATIVLETEATAVWPSLDPQTWQPRGFGVSADPIAIALNPRDEEHSLMLAFRRLATDPALRRRLAKAGQQWVTGHAPMDQTTAAWRQVLTDALNHAPPTRRADWPPHLNADGTERARALLNEVGATVDFLP